MADHALALCVAWTAADMVLIMIHRNCLPWRRSWLSAPCQCPQMMAYVNIFSISTKLCRSHYGCIGFIAVGRFPAACVDPKWRGSGWRIGLGQLQNELWKVWLFILKWLLILTAHRKHSSYHMKQTYVLNVTCQRHISDYEVILAINIKWVAISAICHGDGWSGCSCQKSATSRLAMQVTLVCR